MNTKKIVIAVVIVLIVAVVAFMYISANTAETTIEFKNNNTIKNGDSLSFLLKDNYRHVIPNQVVDVKVLDDSGWAHKYNATTDDQGMAYIQLMGLENGNYTAHASFNGTMFLTSSKTIKEFSIDDGLS